MSKTHPIKVMLVDDQAIIRSGLGAFIMVHDDIELVAEASNGQQAIKLCEEKEPNVVLMDLMMPGMNGVTVTKHIREKCPKTQVIALTSFHNKELVEGALKAGAIGYLLKDVTSEQLAVAIRSAAVGEPTLALEATKILIQATSSPKNEIGYDLTEREREVLILLVEGLNNNQIAERLFVTPSTAKFHVSSILSKLGVANRTEAVSVAYQHDLV